MDKTANEGCFKMRIIEYHDFKTLMGPCFISFSLPLLIPGVVLTVVGSYGNEHTFSRFGAWHVSGIVILSFAVIMLIVGVILKCFYRPTMSADIEQHLSPNPSVITGSKHLGHSDKNKEDDKALNSKGMGNRISPVNYAGKHNVVSTHEKRHKSHSETKTLSNGVVIATSVHTDQAAVGQPVKSRHKPTKDVSDDNHEEVDIAKTIHVKQGISHRNVTDSESEQSDRRGQHSEQEVYTKREPPPAYDEIQHDKHSHKSKKRSRSKQSLVTDNQSVINGVEARSESGNTIATATMTAEVTSRQNIGNSPRDMDSSDAKENTRFLPDKKRRKKKKRVKRRQSELSENAEGTDDTPRKELPALRLKPVLMHEGEPHHHQEYHVHFQTENSADSLQGIRSAKSPEFSGQGVEIDQQQRDHGHRRRLDRSDRNTEYFRNASYNIAEDRAEVQDVDQDNADDRTNGEFYV